VAGRVLAASRKVGRPQWGKSQLLPRRVRQGCPRAVPLVPHHESLTCCGIVVCLGQLVPALGAVRGSSTALGERDGGPTRGGRGGNRNRVPDEGETQLAPSRRGTRSTRLGKVETAAGSIASAQGGVRGASRRCIRAALLCLPAYPRCAGCLTMIIRAKVISPPRRGSGGSGQLELSLPVPRLAIPAQPCSIFVLSPLHQHLVIRFPLPGSPHGGI